MRFIRRSEIVFLTYWVAEWISLSINNLLRHSVTRFLTSKQLSLRTVSIPENRENEQYVKNLLDSNPRIIVIYIISLPSDGNNKKLTYKKLTKELISFQREVKQAASHLLCPSYQISLGSSSKDQHTSSYLLADKDSKPSQTPVLWADNRRWPPK